MVRKTTPTKISCQLSVNQIRAAVPKLKRRLGELESLDMQRLDNETGGHVLDSLTHKINATLRDIFGSESLEYDEYHVQTLRPTFYAVHAAMDISLRGNLDRVKAKVGGTIAKLKAIIDILNEQLGDSSEDSSARTLRAYQGMDLHPEISRAASRFYQDGHYSTAVEAAVKALNALVRLRSGLEQHDGTTLMERAFSPTNPVLRFNHLQDQSDKDEQKGFMQMFSGAVSGLRNPRAHGFINDDPERALEFIAFVSLLAKLLDSATAQ